MLWKASLTSSQALKEGDELLSRLREEHSVSFIIVPTNPSPFSLEIPSSLPSGHCRPTNVTPINSIKKKTLWAKEAALSKALRWCVPAPVSETERVRTEVTGAGGRGEGGVGTHILQDPCIACI